MGRVDYACNPVNTDSLILQMWQDNNEYNPNDPTSKKANYIKYASDIRFRGGPGAFCPHWFTEQFTGYIWLEGEKELRVITDDTYAENRKTDGKPESGECCDGGWEKCGNCQKRYPAAWGCGNKKKTKSQCFKGVGCQWVVWNVSRCSDDYKDNTGFKIGYAYDAAKGVNVPVGEISDTGDPNGLLTVIRSGWGTRLRDQRFDGGSEEFEPGWYPIQAWYTRSNSNVNGFRIARPGGVRVPSISYPRERSDYEYFNLQWRDPSGGSFANVPSSAFTPCTPSCGSSPEAAAPVSPANSAQGMPTDVDFEWNAPGDWGSTCGVQTNTYTVYAGQRAGGVCAAADPSNYTDLPGCTDLADGTTTCSNNTFFTPGTEYCWYVQTNNGEFTTPSNVWWFRTEDPLTLQDWFTTLFGSFYAGFLNIEFPDQADQVNPWIEPFISYESDPTGPAADVARVPSISSNDINIDTNHPKQGVIYFPESQSEFYVKYANFVETWPPNYKGTPPASAVEVSDSDCSGLFKGFMTPEEDVYKADVSCVNTAISDVSGDVYNHDSDGAAILYVTGSGDLRFDNEFIATDEDTRTLFVTGPNVDVKIDRSLSVGDATFGSTSQIDAAFVIVGSIEFEGTNDSEADPDDSILVEGPIITKSALFNRNRGLGNGYPSEVVEYNSYYLYKLTFEERKSEEANYSGLFVIDVDWISEE
jgi:hypothetical protein